MCQNEYCQQPYTSDRDNCNALIFSSSTKLLSSSTKKKGRNSKTYAIWTKLFSPWKKRKRKPTGDLSDLPIQYIAGIISTQSSELDASRPRSTHHLDPRQLFQLRNQSSTEKDESLEAIQPWKQREPAVGLAI